LPEAVKNEDSLILIENFQSTQPKMYILGRGALRICWLLGGMLSALGILFWLPSWCVDWAYKIVARNRHRFFANDKCVLPTPQTRSRFLP
jgi:predicted DCC family thiol-disulfide oxidoreductase YuxK